jgi:hypothetical protein
VDDVLLDAPYGITKMMIASLKISAVVRGSVQPEGERWDPVDDQYRDDHHPSAASGSVGREGRNANHGRDPYALPREMGILHVVPSDNTLTGLPPCSPCSAHLLASLSAFSAQEIVDRIHDQRDRHKQK